MSIYHKSLSFVAPVCAVGPIGVPALCAVGPIGVPALCAVGPIEVPLPDDDFVCAVCRKIPVNPAKNIRIGCSGATFCRTCLYITKSVDPTDMDLQLRCPYTNTGFSRQDIRTSRSIQEAFHALFVHCSSPTCDWTGTVCDLKSHVDNCSFVVLVCPHCHIGVTRKDIDGHPTTCAHGGTRCAIFGCGSYASEPGKMCSRCTRKNVAPEFQASSSIVAPPTLTFDDVELMEFRQSAAKLTALARKLRDTPTVPSAYELYVLLLMNDRSVNHRGIMAMDATILWDIIKDRVPSADAWKYEHILAIWTLDNWNLREGYGGWGYHVHDKPTTRPTAANALFPVAYDRFTNEPPGRLLVLNYGGVLTKTEFMTACTHM